MPMRNLFLFITCLLLSVLPMEAQDKSFILMEQNPEYEFQNWFYCGANNELDRDKIKKLWNDEDKYITSVAYTTNGWFVAMSKDKKYTDQSYHYGSSFGDSWIKEKKNAGYYITSTAVSDKKWFIVMSKYQGYTSQSYNYNSTSNLLKWYEEKRANGYYLTSATYHREGSWLWVMTKGTGIYSQGYTWASPANVGEEIKKLWNKGWKIHLVEYGNGEYLIAYGKYRGRNPQQSYTMSSTGIKDWIDKGWNKGMALHYVGGGNSYQTTTVASNQNNTTYKQNNTTNRQNGYSSTYKAGAKTWTEELPGGGRRQSTLQADGSILSTTSTPCIWCHGTKVCSICNGAGGTYGRAYGGMWYPCRSCAGNKVCQNCHGQGYSILTSTTYPDGSGIGYDQNGRVTVTDGGGGGGYNSSRSSNRSSSRSSNRSSGTCSKCGGKGYEPQRYTYAAGSSMAPYHHTGGSNCYICGWAPSHYHYRCTQCKRK